MTLLVCLLHRLHEFLLPHPETFLHTEDEQAHQCHGWHCRVPACPRGTTEGRKRRHMVRWWREKGRSSARGMWARDASRRNVEISLHERGGRGKGHQVSGFATLQRTSVNLHTHLPIAACQFLQFTLQKLLSLFAPNQESSAAVLLLAMRPMRLTSLAQSWLVHSRAVCPAG